jgi:hypothetical protein
LRRIPRLRLKQVKHELPMGGTAVVRPHECAAGIQLQGARAPGGIRQLGGTVVADTPAEPRNGLGFGLMRGIEPHEVFRERLVHRVSASAGASARSGLPQQKWKRHLHPLARFRLPRSGGPVFVFEREHRRRPIARLAHPHCRSQRHRLIADAKPRRHLRIARRLAAGALGAPRGRRQPRRQERDPLQNVGLPRPIRPDQHRQRRMRRKCRALAGAKAVDPHRFQIQR